MSAKGYRLAVPGRAYSFPRDDAAHPEYATEWWYYTGNLAGPDGRHFGYELTFFRVGVSPHTVRRTSAWAVHDIYFAHLAITDETGQTFHFFDRISRGSLGEAGARTDRYAVHIGDWTARRDGASHVLRAASDGYGLSLRATPAKPPVIHGEHGVSQKAAGRGRASYYYSYTRMPTQGTLNVAGQTYRVRGLSWFDHEFGSNQLAKNQVGWDWFSLQLDDGSEAMLYLMRTASGGIDPYSSGTLVAPDGTARHLARNDFHVQALDHWKSPESGAVYPSRWRITIPEAGLEVTVTPTVADQELRTGGTTGVTYWEGSIDVQGAKSGRPIRGQGYVELTGYAQAFQEVF